MAGKLVPLNLGLRSNPGRDPAAGSARIVNAYAEDAGKEGKIQYPLWASSGLSSWTTLPATGVRAAIEVGAKLYVVSGRQVYAVDAAGSYRVIGGIATDGPVYMARNRRDPAQIGIVSDGLYFLIDTGNNVFTHVSDADLPASSSIACLDGYFIFPGYGDKWFISALNDGSQIDALDFASAESNPDRIVRCETRETELVLFGERTIEWWKNTGAEDFPFGRVTSKEVGCLSAGSVCKIDETLAWIAHDGTVRLMDGYSARRISTHAIERDIAAVTASTIRGMSWWEDGHTFYAITSDDWTWVYDLVTGLWHERESYGLNRWRVSMISRLGSELIAGDYDTGALYKMARTYQDEAGQPLVMTVQTPPVMAYPYRLQFSELYVDVIPGAGLNTTTEPNANPKLMLQFSDDGGVNWSNERMMSVGRLGNTKARIKALRLGVSREDGRMFKLSMSAAVVRGLTGAAVTITQLRS